jgi:hypothetical protein
MTQTVVFDLDEVLLGGDAARVPGQRPEVRAWR